MTRIIALLLAATPAQAQTAPCQTHEDVLALLAKNYGETPAHLGIANNGAVIEILTNPETGAFSIIITDVNGQSCLAAAGEAWTDLKAATGAPA